MTVLERLERKTIKIESGCWLWNGAKISSGYGEIFYEGEMILVHRMSAHLFLGYNLNNKVRQINHQIWCPNKTCWNPEHLYIGTMTDNARDAAGPKKFKTHCKRGHELKGYNAQLGNDGRFRCRICRVNMTRAWRDRNRKNVVA